MEETKNVITVETTKFGKIDVEEGSIFNFVAPIIGFPNDKRFTIVDYKNDSPFKWLQSLDDPDLAFPVTLCSFFGIDYQFDIDDESEKMLEIESAEDIFVCNIANIPSSNPKDATINMLAPVVVNLVNKKAMQIVLKNSKFEVRYKLFKEENTEE